MTHFQRSFFFVNGVPFVVGMIFSGIGLLALYALKWSLPTNLPGMVIFFVFLIFAAAFLAAAYVSLGFGLQRFRIGIDRQHLHLKHALPFPLFWWDRKITTLRINAIQVVLVKKKNFDEGRGSHRNWIIECQMADQTKIKLGHYISQRSVLQVAHFVSSTLKIPCYGPDPSGPFGLKPLHPQAPKPIDFRS